MQHLKGATCDGAEFIALLGGAAAWPLAAQAQQAAKVFQIGFLFYGSSGSSPELDAFRQGLREFGYIEGQNIAVEYRFAGGQVERLPDLAAELVRLKPDVIVTPATPASVAAKQATGTIPIVFAGVADAVGAGLIANLARPDGNVTGLTSISAELGGKRLELLKRLVNNASRVAVLYNPADRSNVLVLKELQEAAPALTLTLQPFEVRGPSEFEGAFAAMTRGRADVRSSRYSYLSAPTNRRGPHCQQSVTDAVGPPAVCGGWRPYVVRREFLRPNTTHRGLRRSDSQRSQTGRSARAAADQVRVHSQSQNRQGAWPHHSAGCNRYCRRGDRISGAMSAIGTKRTCACCTAHVRFRG